MQVVGGTEERTRKLLLHGLGDVVQDVFTPSYEAKRAIKGQWRAVRRQLLPGYVFVQTREPIELSHRLRAVPAFTRLLGSNGEKFMPLSADEAAWLDAKTDAEVPHLIRMSTGVIEGDQVVVMRGPLKGHEYEIKRIDRHKREAELEISLLGRVKRVRVGLEIIAKR